MRRPPNSGSIYQRKDGMWVAAFRKPDGGRLTVKSKSRDRLIEKLADNHNIHWNEEPPRAPTRPDLLVAARTLGTHTRAEWDALRRHTPNCRYCGEELNAWNESKDHAVPLSLGGSDAIDNIQRICWECNNDKGDQMPDEYHYDGGPRGFVVHPARRAEWDRTKRLYEARGRNHG